MTYETLLIEHHDAVTLVRLNRPQALNALNSQVLAELIDAFAAYDADAGQRCLVLTGSEKAFAAGAEASPLRRAAGPQAPSGRASGTRLEESDAAADT